MNKERALEKIAREIIACARCKKDGTGKAVPGEGSPSAQIFFVGEAPGKEEAKVGRPFVGRSGKFLRDNIRKIGIDEDNIFITSPGHYLPLRRTPSKETILHGRTHLLRQVKIIDPRIMVLLGNTACIAMLGGKVEIASEHGTLIERNGRKFFITFHPAYAMRFPEGRKLFLRDFQKLKKIVFSPAFREVPK